MAEGRISKILPLLIPMRGRVFGLIGLSVLHGATGLVLMRAVGHSHLQLPLFLLLTLLAGVLLSYFEELMIIPVSAHVGKELWAMSFPALLWQPRSQIQLDVLKKVESEAAWMADWVVSILRTLFRRVLQLVLFGGSLVFLDHRLMLVMLPFFIAFFLLGLILGKKTGALRRDLFQAEGDLARFQAEAVVHVESVRGYDAVDYMETLHRGHLDRLWTVEMNHRRFQALYAPLSFFILGAGAFTVWLYGTRLLSAQEMSPSTVSAFLTGLVLLYPPLSGFGRDLLQAWSVREVPWLDTLLEDQRNLPNRVPIGESISLNRVSLGYEVPVLVDFSHTFRKGTLTGIRGTNGAGKTTVIQVLLGILRPQSGEVLVDQKRGLPSGSQVGFLDQEGALFFGSADMNIRFGRAPVKKENEPLFVHRAGPLCDTSVSGGERRRIALDRAFYGVPRLVVLDEPEESLDSQSLSLVVTRLKSLRDAGAIVILVSHEPTLLALCDEVISMERPR